MRAQLVGQTLKTQFRTTDGRKFFGNMVPPIDTTIGFNIFFTARRLMQVSVKSLLKPGDTFTDPVGDTWLTAKHGDIQLRGVPLVTFLCYNVTKTIVWERYTTTTDPVTQLVVQATSKTPLGSIPVVWEPIKKEEDQLQVPKQRYRILTSSSIQVEDILDTKFVVLNVEPVLGLFLVEAQ